MKTACDAWLDGVRVCSSAVFECGCGRCQREPEASERFFACGAHRDAVNAAHERVRGVPAQWRRI